MVSTNILKISREMILDTAWLADVWLIHAR
jgi:hypothetical protein